MQPERLKQAESFGCETVDVSKGAPEDQIEQLLGIPFVDAAVDAVGFEAKGHGEGAGEEAPATVLNSLMDVTFAAGGIGIPGLYVTGDPGGIDEAAQKGALSLSLGPLRQLGGDLPGCEHVDGERERADVEGEGRQAMQGHDLADVKSQ